MSETGPISNDRDPSYPRDVLSKDLDVLIVAINPSPHSAAVGHSFSSPTNPFWRLLHESGLTPTQLAPSDEHRLSEYGIGLTTTVRRPTASAGELSAAERRAGAYEVRKTVAEYRPRYVALLGLTLFPVFFPRTSSAGAGLASVRLEGSAVYVLPNPSGRNRAFPGFDNKLVWFRDLAQVLGRTSLRRRGNG